MDEFLIFGDNRDSECLHKKNLEEEIENGIIKVTILKQRRQWRNHFRRKKVSMKQCTY